jgi:hypothetical protein
LFIPNRLLAWNSTITVLVFGFEGNNGSDTYSLMLGRVNDGDQIDFQVQAYVGNWFPGKAVNIVTGSNIEYKLLNIDAIGDWSPTQTITIPASYVSTSPTTTVPEFPSIIAILFLLTASLLGTMMFKKQFFKVQTVK